VQGAPAPCTPKCVQVHCAFPGIATDLEGCVQRTEVLINQGVFKSEALVSHRFKLEKITDAFKALESRCAGYLKGIVEA